MLTWVEPCAMPFLPQWITTLEPWARINPSSLQLPPAGVCLSDVKGRCPIYKFMWRIFESSLFCHYVCMFSVVCSHVVPKLLLTAFLPWDQNITHQIHQRISVQGEKGLQGHAHSQHLLPRGRFATWLLCHTKTITSPFLQKCLCWCFLCVPSSLCSGSNWSLNSVYLNFQILIATTADTCLFTPRLLEFPNRRQCGRLFFSVHPVCSRVLRPACLS